MTIEEERAIVDAATPGPWWFDEDEHCWRLHGVAMTLPSPFDGFSEQHVGKQILKARKQDDQMMPYWPEPADAKFIARARTMYPLALDVVEAYERWGKASIARESLNFSSPGNPAVAELREATEVLRAAREAFEAATE